MKLFKYALLGAGSLFLSGCLGFDASKDMTIYTTVYPVEYITNEIFGDYAEIESIYPNGADIETYTLTNKKLNDFADSDLFIYNGLGTEKQIAASLIHKNRKMDIIDVAQGLETNKDMAELWLSPSNFLMMAQNIKNGLIEQVKSTSTIEDINEKYEQLKVKISEFDAELKLIADNANNKQIIVANKAFNFLEKYGFEVICISSDDENSNTNLSKAKNAFSSKANNYLFMLQGTDENDEIKDLVSAGAKKYEVKVIATLTDEEIKNNVDYISVVRDFIDNVKSEAY